MCHKLCYSRQKHISRFHLRDKLKINFVQCSDRLSAAIFQSKCHTLGIKKTITLCQCRSPRRATLFGYNKSLRKNPLRKEFNV